MEENKDIKDKVWEVNFVNFINGLGLECLVGLGKIENPLTKRKEVNPKQVRYIIDTLDMLKEKTEGNLKDDEQKIIDELSSYLKMVYVEIQGEKDKEKKEDKEEKNAEGEEEPKDKDLDSGEVEKDSKSEIVEDKIEDKAESKDDK
ncbi:MAG: DUF1844 domain-containing protein [Candidatus Kaelpia imicola]|nr:DUF1844 domain-containing protein [Candidatus Kaelpia imicola]